MKRRALLRARLSSTSPTRGTGGLQHRAAVGTHVRQPARSIPAVTFVSAEMRASAARRIRALVGARTAVNTCHGSLRSLPLRASEPTPIACEARLGARETGLGACPPGISRYAREMTVDAAFRPTSAAQAEATRAGAVAAPEDLDANTFVVPMPTGIPFVVSTLCYVLRDSTGAAHIIDPGIDDSGNLDFLLGELRARGIDRIASVTATHMHADHLGLARLVRERTGAKLCFGRVESHAGESTWRNLDGRVPALDEWGVPEDRRGEILEIGDAAGLTGALDPDLVLDDGDELPVPGRRVTAMVTPGHTPGHLCFAERDAQRIFTGDHVLPHINPGLGLGHPFDGNAMTIGIEALEAIAALDASGDASDAGQASRVGAGRMLEALPGHGYRFVGLGSRALAIVAHHRTRSAEVAAVLDRAPDSTVWEVASQVRWTAGWDGLGGFHRLSALAQTALHVDRVRRGHVSDLRAAGESSIVH